jgi:predicted transcriptional regulator
VLDAINARPARKWAHTTILTAMRRLDRKALLRLDERRGRRDADVLARDEYADAREALQVRGARVRVPRGRVGPLLAADLASRARASLGEPAAGAE